MEQFDHTIPRVFLLMQMVSHPGHGTRNVREDFLVILVGLQMCQSWYQEILVMAPEIQERFLSLNSLLLNWPMLEICNVLCTSCCVVFMMFPLSWDRSLGRYF